MRPGPRLIQVFAILLAASLLVPLAPGLTYVLVPAVGVALFAAVAERILLGRVSIVAERHPKMALSLDEEQPVALALKSTSDRPLSLTVRQTWPGLVDRPSSTLRGEVRPGEVLALQYTVRSVSRGTETVPPPHVAASIWGFSERIVEAGEPAQLNVLPNLRAVKRLHGQLNQFVLRGLGTRTAPRLGKGREFDRLREYVKDDDFRDIAWKASARHRKLIVREFRIDRSQDVLVCLDRGHRMASRAGYITRLDHAINATMLLAYVCNRMEDRVGMLSFGAEVERGISQGRGAAHLRALTAFGTGVKAEYIHTDYLALAVHIRRRLHQRSLILIMTDLPEGEGRNSLVKAVSMLTPQHLPVVVILSDPALEAIARLHPADQGELCRTLVAKDVWHERQQTMRELRRRGALVVNTRPEDTGVDSINAYIDVKRRQLL